MADYDFSKAENIISIDADFLSDWQGGGYSSGYTKKEFLISLRIKLCLIIFSLSQICL
jgi:hypothetical protein